MAIDRLSYILTTAQVPRLHRRHVRRSVYARFEAFAQQHILDKALQSPIALVHGAAGVGKTNLLCDWLWSRSDICGHYYKQIIWLTDRNIDARKVSALGVDALLMLSEGALPLDLTALSTSSDGFESTTASASLATEVRAYARPQTTRIMLSRALEAQPQTLIVLDDVVLRESIDLFAGLECSIIATSTRADIFNHLDDMAHFSLCSEDASVEDVAALAHAYDFESVGEHSARRIRRISGGNFALIEKLFVSAHRSTETLQLLLERIQACSLEIVDCASYYQYTSLCTSGDLMRSTISPKNLNALQVESRLQLNLPFLALLEPLWPTDKELLASLWPVDVIGGSGEDERQQVVRLVVADVERLVAHSFLEVSNSETLSINSVRLAPFVAYYLLSIADASSLLVSSFIITNQRLQCLQNALELFRSTLANNRDFNFYLTETADSYQALESRLIRTVKSARPGDYTSSTSAARSSWLPAWLSSLLW